MQVEGNFGVLGAEFLVSESGGLTKAGEQKGSPRSPESNPPCGSNEAIYFVLLTFPPASTISSVCLSGALLQGALSSLPVPQHHSCLLNAPH